MSTPTLTPAECAELQSGRAAKLALATACPTKASQDMYAALVQIAQNHFGQFCDGCECSDAEQELARDVLKRHGLFFS